MGLVGSWSGGYKVREDDILPYKLLIGDFFGGKVGKRRFLHFGRNDGGGLF